jgi:hypothetical protein
MKLLQCSICRKDATCKDDVITFYCSECVDSFFSTRMKETPTLGSPGAMSAHLTGVASKRG